MNRKTRKPISMVLTWLLVIALLPVVPAGAEAGKESPSLAEEIVVAADITETPEEDYAVPEDEAVLPEEESADVAEEEASTDALPEHVPADETDPVEEEETTPEETETEADEIFEEYDATEVFESLSEMEGMLPLNIMTEDWSENLLAVARSQLGYSAMESGYSRYADWCSRYASDWCYECKAEWNRGELSGSWRDSWQIDAYEQWDACFVSFCLYYSGVPVEQMPPAPTAEYWIKILDAAGMPIATEYKPAPGDLIFFDWDEENNEIIYDDNGRAERIILVADHVGIVSYAADDGELWYVMGGYDDMVQEKRTWLDDETILGYAVLPEEPQPEEIAAEEEITDLIDGTAEEKPEESKSEETADDDGAEEFVAPQLENTAGDVNAIETVDEMDEAPADKSEEVAEEDEPVLEDLTKTPPTVIADTYAFAPSDYVLLRVNDDLSANQIYVFNGVPLYHTGHPVYLVNIMDAGAFVMLIPAEFVESGALTEVGQQLLRVADGERQELTYSSDVNGDGVVNIADANAIYQMIQNGGDYYTVEQIGLEARLRLQNEDIDTLDSAMDEING